MAGRVHRRCAAFGWILLIFIAFAGRSAQAAGPPTRMAVALNVKSDFGARGDGTSDDTAAIDAAIRAMNARPAALEFPPGTYRVCRLDPILAAGVRVIGAGRGATTIATYCPTGDVLTELGYEDSVEDLSFSPSVFRRSGYDVVLRNASYSILRDLAFTYSFDAIEILSSSQVAIEDINVQRITGDVGVYFGGSASASSYGLWIRNYLGGSAFVAAATSANVKTWSNGAHYEAGDLLSANGWVWQVAGGGTTAAVGPPPSAPAAMGWDRRRITNGAAQLVPLFKADQKWLVMGSYANSVEGTNLSLVGGDGGFAMQDQAGAGSSYPSWAFFSDLEVDHPYGGAVQAQAGLGLHITLSYLGSSLTGSGVAAGPKFLGELTIDGGTRIFGNGRHGLDVAAGKLIKIDGSIFACNSQLKNGAFQDIFFGSAVSDYTISNNSTGAAAPGARCANRAAYGIYLAAPASRTRSSVIGNVSDGNVRGAEFQGR